MNRTLIVVCTVLVGLLSHVNSGSAQQPRYRSPDPEISQLQLGGIWKEGPSSGQYRAVVRTRCTPEHCYDDLYVEWLAPFGSKRGVIASKRVEQVGGNTQVMRLEFVNNRDDNRLEIEHRAGDDDATDRWIICLALSGPSKYASTDGRCRR